MLGIVMSFIGLLILYVSTRLIPDRYAQFKPFTGIGYVVLDRYTGLFPV
jgi:hypothetical protein